MTDLAEQEARDDAEIQKGFHEFTVKTVAQIVDSSRVYADNGQQMVAVAVTLVESIAVGVLGNLPIRPGNEAKIMKLMRDNVIRRMAQSRMLSGEVKGHG